jgi:hypothetical protein
MVIKSIIDSRFKKSMLGIVGGLLVFHAISAIAQKKPDYPGFIISTLFIVWISSALCVLACIVFIIVLSFISVSIKICIHEPHSSGVFARGIKKYYDKDIEYFDSVRICGIWICCDVWKEGGVKCIEDNK